MPNQIEYKRVTKNLVISQLIILALTFLAFGFFLDWLNWIMFPTWFGLSIFSLTLYWYALDKKMKPILITPIYLFVTACLQTFLFFALSNLSISLAYNLIIVIIMYISSVINSFKGIGYPPYVKDGKYVIEDAKKYSLKQIKKLALFLGAFLLFSIILYLVLLLWKNSLLGND